MSVSKRKTGYEIGKPEGGFLFARIVGRQHAAGFLGGGAQAVEEFRVMFSASIATVRRPLEGHFILW